MHTNPEHPDPGADAAVGLRAERLSRFERRRGRPLVRGGESPLAGTLNPWFREGEAIQFVMSRGDTRFSTFWIALAKGLGFMKN